MKNKFVFLLVAIFLLIPAQNLPAKSFSEKISKDKKVYKKYVQFFDEIYDTMEKNYYYSVRRDNFNLFIKKFDTEIYEKLESKSRFDEFVAMRSGALLIDFLKTKDDVFSALFPPPAVEDFKKEVLGKRVDLGIEGSLIDSGYLVSFIEPRSDAFENGLRENDVIVRIDKNNIRKLTEEKIKELLIPPIDSIVKIEYIHPPSKKEITISVVSREYFKQTVFPITIHVPNIYCLQIQKFNQKTAEDMSRYIAIINSQEISGLILDLRGNPGGPPLAAREIVSFFLEPEKEFAYFQRKGDERNVLDVPKIPEPYRYHGPITILVDKESGSASELFSGVMQEQGRALLIGTQTAGQVFLKSMFDLKYDAMLLLVTARGHFPDGKVFNFDGLTPQFYVDEKGVDLVYFAAGYLSATLGKNKL